MQKLRYRQGVGEPLICPSGIIDQRGVRKGNFSIRPRQLSHTALAFSKELVAQQVRDSVATFLRCATFPTSYCFGGEYAATALDLIGLPEGGRRGGAVYLKHVPVLTERVPQSVPLCLLTRSSALIVSPSILLEKQRCPVSTPLLLVPATANHTLMILQHATKAR